MLFTLRESPAYPSELAVLLAVSRQGWSSHLACQRGCGFMVAEPQGRRVRQELADAGVVRALGDLLTVVRAVDPATCAAVAEGCC